MSTQSAHDHYEAARTQLKSISEKIQTHMWTDLFHSTWEEMMQPLYTSLMIALPSFTVDDSSLFPHRCVLVNLDKMVLSWRVSTGWVVASLVDKFYIPLFSDPPCPENPHIHVPIPECDYDPELETFEEYLERRRAIHEDRRLHAIRWIHGRIGEATLDLLRAMHTYLSICSRVYADSNRVCMPI